MATLSRNGKEIGRWERNFARYALFENRWILRNNGTGWKRYARVKEGVDLAQYYQTVLDARAAFKAKNPFGFTYVERIRQEPIDLWYRLDAAVKNNSQDLDGMFSELDDDYQTRNRYSLEDCREILNLYKAASLHTN